jgi:hypothetical protein
METRKTLRPKTTLIATKESKAKKALKKEKALKREKALEEERIRS